MSARAAKRSHRGLQERQKDFDLLGFNDRSSRVRPGSLNRKKNGVRTIKGKKR